MAGKRKDKGGEPGRRLERKKRKVKEEDRQDKSLKTFNT